MAKTKLPTSIFVEGRSWFDSNSGNSWFSCRVWVDGDIALYITPDMGYDNHYQDDALVMLRNRGYLPKDCMSRHDIRELGIHYYTVNNYGLKREMFKARKGQDL